MIQAERFHDIDCGHRVAGHENKCAHIHGHSYRVHFACQGEQDSLGRVIDFGVIKSRLCVWLESNWDHKFLAWHKDDVMITVNNALGLHAVRHNYDATRAACSIVWLPFNPTAENLALYLLNEIGPAQLLGTSVTLTSVRIEETRKCSVTVAL